MHAENRPEDANPNTWTPAGSDVRQAAEIVNKNMLAGEIPHADHLATVLRAAVAYIDEINRANDAPREIQGRLERIESLKAPLTRAEVLGAIADLRVMVDLHGRPQATPNELASAAKILINAFDQNQRQDVKSALRTLEEKILGTTTLPSSDLSMLPKLGDKQGGTRPLRLDEETFNAVTVGLWHALRLGGEERPEVGSTIVLTSKETNRRLYVRTDRVEGALVVFGRYPAAHGQTVHNESGAYDHLGVYT